MLIPDNITDFQSTGEQILYRKFKLDGSTDHMYVLHSVFTNNHITNPCGELDFLVLAPNEGFFTIEVKHGQVSRKKGMWCYTNRFGKTDCKDKGPFEQQSATQHSIRKYVLDKLRHKREMHERFRKILWGSGVAFTSMKEFIDFGPEGHSWQVLTENGLKNSPIGMYISTLSKGAHKEHSQKIWYDIHESRPTKKDCEDLIKLLRGDFSIKYSEINRINDNECLIEEYTKEQFALLDFVNYNQRCLVEGQAGTGKTLMALELVRRKCKENLNVGLLCYNKQLGTKLFHSTQQIESNSSCVVFSGTLHSYMAQKTKSIPPGDDSQLHKYYSEDLPIEFLIWSESLSEEDKFDILILDEAQDLISPSYIEVFDSILKGGIKNGNWIMFGDFSNQAIYLNNPKESLNLLNSYSTYAHLPPLKINCRNTRSIAKQNTLLTGAELPLFTSRNDEGTRVICKYPFKNFQADTIYSIISDIKEREIPFSKVTLLSPKKLENSILDRSKTIDRFIKEGGEVNTIHAFKGLENTIIILFDFDDVNSEQMQRLLYVGISRARQELYIILDKNLEDSVTRLIGANFSKTKMP